MKKSIISLMSLGLIICSSLVAEAQSPGAQKSPTLEESIRLRVANRKVAMKKYVPKILELQKAINQSSAVFLISSRLNKDAGPFLNPRIGWEDVVSDVPAKAAYEKYMASLGTAKVTKLTVPTETAEKLKSLGPDYYKKANEIDLKSIDFGWLKELQQYDFWNTEDNSPLAYLEKFDFTQNPIPNFVSLIAWAKLRLVKGVQERNVKSAIDETVHLGRLLHSTETLIGAVSSIAVLKAVVQFAKDQGTPLNVDLAVFDKAKLYFMSLPKALSNPLIDAQDFAHISQAGFGPGYCAAVNEAGSGLLMFKPLLEIDLKDVYAKYDAILKSKTACRWVHIRKAWAGDSKYVVHFKSLPSASAEARKQASELIKQSLSEDDFRKLTGETANPRWPQYFGYLQALLLTPESMFSNLGVK
jgi:hypothetical protein